MTEFTKSTVGTAFWVVGIIALLWYAFGVFQFVGSLTATPEGMAEYVSNGIMTQDYADFLLALPVWVKAVFGLATIGGLVATICLLMRKGFAKILFVISLVGALLMYLYMFVLSGKADILPVFDYIIAAMVVAVTCFMIWWSRRQSALGHLS